MADREKMKDAVRNYLQYLQTGTGDDIVALFAEDCTVADPADGDVLRGHDQIRPFFTNNAAMDHTIELVAVRVAGNTAAAHFTVRTKAGEQTYLSAPIDLFEFDDDNLITSMKAYWGPEDMSVE
ncbi:MAG: SnoaL-like domain-containing protein [Propionibacterium sp.]|nr:SnoaL-like domain-containing protein [Propionibacterium sp.]